MQTAVASTSFSEFRNNFAQEWNAIEEDQQVRIVTRRGHQALAVLPADELGAILETIYLIRSPANLKALQEALAQSRSKKLKPQSIEDIRAASMKRKKRATKKQD